MRDPGERLNGIQEVSGSIPLISTKQKAHIVIYVSLLLYYRTIAKIYEDGHLIQGFQACASCTGFLCPFSENPQRKRKQLCEKII